MNCHKEDFELLSVTMERLISDFKTKTMATSRKASQFVVVKPEVVRQKQKHFDADIAFEMAQMKITYVNRSP
jgi:hypothetical protein